jgi:hypothetical protein
VVINQEVYEPINLCSSDRHVDRKEVDINTVLQYGMPKECLNSNCWWENAINLLRTHTLTQASIKQSNILSQALLVQHQVYERELPPEVYMKNSIVISWFNSNVLDVCLLTATWTFFSAISGACHHYKWPGWKFRSIFNSPGFNS